MIPFKSTQDALRELSHDSIAQLIGASHDITLLVNDEGVIVDIAFGADRPLDRLADGWIGKAWVETVTDESRGKIERLLADAAADTGVRRWRQVNHPVDDRADLPILYLAVRAGDSDLTLAIGKDLRVISEMQQQLLEMQQSIESEYARLQQAESRYRLLFQTTAEAIVIAEPGTGRIVEVNPAAALVLGDKQTRLIGRSLHKLLADGSRDALDDMLTKVSATGKQHRATATLADREADVKIAAVPLLRESTRLLMLRLTDDGLATEGHRDLHERLLLALAEDTPDAIVITDAAGQIQSANGAFTELCQVASEAQLREQPLDQWIGRPGVDINVIRKNLQQHGSLRQFSTVVNVEYGQPVDVDLSAVAFEAQGEPRFGFVLRQSLRPVEAAKRIEAESSLPRSVEQMTELVGRVPLKELIRETTDILERLCIEAALRTTGGNRASAAEMLGLSRQSLYVKLRRYGLAGDDADKKS